MLARTYAENMHTHMNTHARRHVHINTHAHAHARSFSVFDRVLMYKIL